ncbi:MAG TPA: TRAP transporter permease, partial [Firmicutes bacterium]|nr:TRAP transporter permease [Bacillota bacterium]
PVAVAAYAAAGIAGVSYSRIGWLAFKIGLAGFIIPYLFIYDPAMLLIGTVPQIILVVVAAVTGITALVGGIQGWFLIPLRSKLLRIALIVCGLVLIYPSTLTNIVGLGLAALIFAMQYLELKKEKGGIAA